ncbi:MAG: hypothetical protein AW07_03079 [Candidatus Accumulibacter sp. SK-11]|nr:MAG: hypothetical protein AW07_03079 [Candidatus Accumulibacter sp. SK-11]
MPGPGQEAQEEIHRQQVHQHAESATQTILRLAMQTSAVVHHFFLNATGHGSHRHPCRDEAMHLTVQPNFLDDRGAVDLEAATVVVQANASDVADQSIGDARRDRSQPDVVLTVLPPADHQIEIAVQEAADQSGHVGGIVLQVPVECGDDVAAGRIDTRLHGGGLAEIALQTEHTHVRPVLAKIGAQALIGAVAAAVVHDDQFPRAGIMREGLVNSRQQWGDIVAFVVQGYDHRQAMRWQDSGGCQWCRGRRRGAAFGVHGDCA